MEKQQNLLPTESHPHNHSGELQQSHGDHEWTEETIRWYAEEYGDWPSNRMTVEAIGLLPNDIVLDVGCGTGSAIREAAKYVTQGRLIGADPYAEMLRIAWKQTLNHEAESRIKYVECYAENLVLEKESITVAMAINALHHWNDILVGLKEVRRVLTPEGRFFVAEDHDVQEMSGFTSDNVREALKKAGFIDLKMQTFKAGEVILDFHSARKG